MWLKLLARVFPTTPVRFRWATVVAWLASVAGIVLAIGKGGRYDPNLAVLTATLLAVVWYTYWGFVAANRQEPSYVSVDLHAELECLILRPTVANATRHRTVSLQVFMDVWLLDEPVDIGRFYRGEELTDLGPGDGWKGAVTLKPAVDKRNVPLLLRMGTVTTEKVKVRLRARWIDDLGEACESRVKHWMVTFAESSAPRGIEAVLGTSEIARHFGRLPPLNIDIVSGDVIGFQEGEPRLSG